MVVEDAIIKKEWETLIPDPAWKAVIFTLRPTNLTTSQATLSPVQFILELIPDVPLMPPLFTSKSTAMNTSVIIMIREVRMEKREERDRSYITLWSTSI